VPAGVRRLPRGWLHVEVAQQCRGGVPGLPPAAPDLGEGAGVAKDLADSGLALRDAQVGQFRRKLDGRAVAAGAAGERVQAGAPEDRQVAALRDT
jgi:hypothetical protein